MALSDRPVLRPRTRAAWRRWLAAHHASSDGAWVEFPKVGSGVAGPTYDDVVEEALCFGWIDSIVHRSPDPAMRRLHLTPRKPGGIWAKSNRARIARLSAAGLITEAGQTVIDRARRDGSWNVLADVEAEVIPKDLAAAFASVRGSRARFKAEPPSRRQQLLYWIASAKRPETRARRIEAIVRGTVP